MPLIAAGQHRPAADDMAGMFSRAAAIIIAGLILSQLVIEHEPVELVRHRHRLDRIGDQLAAGQRVVHPGVAHGDAVADADGRELDGRAARPLDARLHRLGDGVQVHVPGDDLVLGVDHADQRAVQLLIRQPQRVEQAAMRRRAAAPS